MIEKIRAYLGFCLRAGKILFGADDLEVYRKKIHLILVDESLAENSLKRVHKANETFHAPVLTFQSGLLGELLHRPAVKVASIKDFNLAKAILAAVGEKKTIEN